jgi:hypothetical protein
MRGRVAQAATHARAQQQPQPHDRQYLPNDVSPRESPSGVRSATLPKSDSAAKFGFVLSLTGAVKTGDVPQIVVRE